VVSGLSGVALAAKLVQPIDGISILVLEDKTRMWGMAFEGKTRENIMARELDRVKSDIVSQVLDGPGLSR